MVFSPQEPVNPKDLHHPQRNDTRAITQRQLMVHMGLGARAELSPHAGATRRLPPPELSGRSLEMLVSVGFPGVLRQALRVAPQTPSPVGARGQAGSLRRRIWSLDSND